MTAAEDDMAEGYRDGRRADSPEPSQNRSRSYRHGFLAGRNDLLHRERPAEHGPDEMRRMAEEAIAADEADVAMMGGGS